MSSDLRALLEEALPVVETHLAAHGDRADPRLVELQHRMVAALRPRDGGGRRPETDCHLCTDCGARKPFQLITGGIHVSND